MPPYSREDLAKIWYWYLTGQNKTRFSARYEAMSNVMRRTMALFPGTPRCVECNRPMLGLGGWLTHTHRSSYSPQLCDMCETAMRSDEAGAEVPLSLLFADVRGSTRLAETQSTTEFKQLIQRFYQAAGDVIIQHEGLVNRLMGDQVIGLFVPRFAGADHAKVAVAAALDLLRATGHGQPGGPWVPCGIGIHTGQAYVGAVGSKSGVNEIAVLGSAPNLAARLSSQAADGEVLVSESAAASARLPGEGAEIRQLELKGLSQPVAAWVLRVAQ